MNGIGKSFTYENGTIVPDSNGAVVGAEPVNNNQFFYAAIRIQNTYNEITLRISTLLKFLDGNQNITILDF